MYVGGQARGLWQPWQPVWICPGGLSQQLFRASAEMWLAKSPWEHLSTAHGWVWDRQRAQVDMQSHLGLCPDATVPTSVMRVTSYNVSSIPAHHIMCPKELVTCKYSEAGCNVNVVSTRFTDTCLWKHWTSPQSCNGKDLNSEATSSGCWRKE